MNQQYDDNDMRMMWVCNLIGIACAIAILLIMAMTEAAGEEFRFSGWVYEGKRYHAPSPHSLFQILSSRDTIWTDPSSHPPFQVTVFSDRSEQVMPLGMNPTRRQFRHLTNTGSPNNESPWRHPGGTDAIVNRLTKRTGYLIPGKVKVWRESRMVPGQKVGQTGRGDRRVIHWAGTYPVGSAAAEFLSVDGTLRAVRVRTKTAEGWIGEQVEVAPFPSGYEAPSSCVDCHEDIGRHANEIDDHQEWYFTVRGLEKGGFFNSPVMQMKDRRLHWERRLVEFIDH